MPKYPQTSSDEFLWPLINDVQLWLLELYGQGIIMMDSTHEMNQYGFQLTTIMVNDSNHEGFPVAVLYSTRTAAETFIPFFAEIKHRCPNVKPSVFISDDDPAFYNAWKSVFGETEHQLLCSWHVLRAWNTNLNLKVKDRELRASMKNDLAALLHETDEKQFKVLSEKFISDSLLNDSAKLFAEYFLTYYMKRTKLWAYCYRTNCGINTNMKLERWHREIKYEEADSKVIKRLDKSICIVLNAISKKMIGRIVSMERHKLTKRVAEIRKRHDSSKLLSKDSVLEMTPGVKWIVNSSKATTSTMLLETYEVSYEKDCFCDVKCTECNVCIHKLSCTCHDFCIRFIICKHIHLVCQNFHIGSSHSSNSSDNESALIIDIHSEKQNVEQSVIVEELKKSVTPLANIEADKSAILAKFATLLENANTYDTINLCKESVEVLEKKILAANSSQPHKFLTKISKPPNTNIDPQKRFVVKTKKKKAI